jgi:hypothetical protein
LALAAACAKVDMPAGTVSSSDGGGGTGGFVLDAGRDLTSSIDGIGAVQPPVPPAGNGGGPCENLCKRQMACAGGGDTTISGVVHAPTPPALGTADPLYNALVYVPNAPVTKFTPGVACERCAPVSGAPLVKTLTGPDGKFTLRNAPVGAAVPLVIQIGRWRRQVAIPNVAPCTDTQLPDELTRMPRNQTEGEIPAIAVATGDYDPFDCTLRKIGIAESEFTASSGNGRVNLWPYYGHQPATGTARGGDELMGSLDNLSRYDLVILPCDSRAPKAKALEDNLVAYTGRGGRVFLTDLGYSWLQSDPVFNATVNWVPPDGLVEGADFTTLVDQTFPKGMAFSAWLSAIGAARPATGQIPVHDPFMGHSYITSPVAPTQSWLYTQGPYSTIQLVTFNTPIGMPDDQQCGRVVYTQFHVANDGASNAFGDNHFPSACNNDPMTPQEKALEFMVFDLSSCLQADRAPVVIP